MRRWVRTGVCVALVATGVVGLLGGGGTAAAQATPVFFGTASAEGLRIGLVAVGAPVTNQLVDAASPLAQASLDSTTGAASIASVAYPGDLVLTAPGLVAGLTGGATSGLIPEYPLVAQAGSTTTPSSRVELPGMTMAATGETGHASATASVGNPVVDAVPSLTYTTTADVTVDDAGVVTATATAVTSAIAVGPLSIGSITSTSTVTRAPGEEPVRDASFEIAGIKVLDLDLTIGLTDEGLVLGGTTIPLPLTALTDLLAAVGFEIDLLDEIVTDDGVIAGGVMIRRLQQLADFPISPVTVSLNFGRTVASVSDVTLPRIRVPSDGGDAPTPTTAAPAAAVSSGGGRGASSGGVAGAPPVAAPGLTPPVTQPPTLVASSSTGHGAPLFDLRSLYLALCIGAGGAGVVLELLRLLGVRPRWD